MWQPGRRSPASTANIGSLPDELLEAVLRLVPETTTELLDAVVQLESRGPVERVCRRWRRFTLQLPASLTLDLCGLHALGLDADGAAEVLEPLLPLFSKRCITELNVFGCTECLPATLPASLARALFPHLLRLGLGGGSLLHWTTFLPLCARLEVLDIKLAHGLEEENEHLLCSHLCGLSCPLQQLRLQADHALEMLQGTISRHLQPAELAMVAHRPAAVAWVPQLTECTVVISLPAHLVTLASGLQAAASLGQLRSLRIHATQLPAAQAAAMPAALPGLADLPALCQLECRGIVPQTVWACPHLTSLLLTRAFNAAGFELPEGSAALCTSLRQLRISGCTLPSGAFPAALCPALRQLSSLAILSSSMTGGLPPAFSQLSALQQLVIMCAPLGAASVQAFCQLQGLTALHLPGCDLHSLPDGPYLSSLISLDIAFNPLPASPIPFAVTAALGLCALYINGPEQDWEAADWLDLEWKLHCFKRLEVLYIGYDPDDTTDPVLEELASLLSSNCFSFKLDLTNELSEHPVYSGLADFGSLEEPDDE